MKQLACDYSQKKSLPVYRFTGNEKYNALFDENSDTHEGISLNPFSIKTPIPWCLIFNLISWFFVWILDAGIGEPFNDLWKASLCLVFFIPHLTYYVYIVVIHMALVYQDVSLLIDRKKKIGTQEEQVSLSLWRIMGIIAANGLVWTWIFTSLFYFNSAFYATNIVTEPRYLFYVSLRLWAFTVLAANGVGYGSTIPIHVAPEIFSAFNIITTAALYVIVFAAIIGILLDKYSNTRKKKTTTATQRKRQTAKTRLSPFSVETRVPWILIFNLVLWSFVSILDGAIGANFSSLWKASLCIVVFVFSIMYYLYVIILHMSLIYPELGITLDVPHETALDLWDILNVFASTALVWAWLFTALFYFNETSFYASNLVEKPRLFIEIAARFWHFAVFVSNGIGFGAVIPNQILSEITAALCVLLAQFVNITFVGPATSLVLIKYTYGDRK